MPIIAYFAAKLATKIGAYIAMALCVVLFMTTIGFGAATFITRHTLALRTQELAAEKTAHAQDIQKWKDATVAALDADKAHAATVENQQSSITEDEQNADTKSLADNRSAARDWVRSHPGPAVSRGSTKDLPPAADATGSSDGALATTVILASDADACAQAYTVAIGWQNWWAKEAPVWKAGAAPSVPTIGAVTDGIEPFNSPIRNVSGIDPVKLGVVPAAAVSQVRTDRETQTAEAGADDPDADPNSPAHANFLP